ncbi:Clp protease N-terminal domain-containing protein [Dactylosporangium sp. AC04546]|uniref:Clp protease N-terminal domain-containing protein n=1 Tax=Dactylosporangium sp. AC04546 TaxID=2862460 RepID=UPI001EDF8F6D|nr:Clp protease N-terminal domain-containing protein [Dactylosporangium sp. AC04546]WVK87147.1 Clp protease N-terminal domain-containing protein [Dactylosporangium sp. AC04546]
MSDDEPRSVHLSSRVVDALTAAVLTAWRAEEDVVGLPRLIEALDRRTARWQDRPRDEPLRPADDIHAPAVGERWRFETSGALREAVWQAGLKLRAPSLQAAPRWSPEVQPILRQALATAYEQTSVRFLGELWLLQYIVGPTLPLVRPEHEFRLFVDGSPACEAVDTLEVAGLLAQRSLLDWPGRVVTRVGRLTVPGWGGPMPFIFRRETIRQAVRFGATATSQVHLIMAICAVEWALEQTHNTFESRVAATNRAGALLNEYGVWHLSILHDAMTDLPEYPVLGKDLACTRAAAARTARQEYGHRFIGTSHLLHAIVSDVGGRGSGRWRRSDVGGPGSRALRTLGADPGELRDRLDRELRQAKQVW